MSSIVYSGIFYLITPLLLLKLWWRGRKAPAYRERILERFGFASATTANPPLWVHAVSMGETIAIAPVIKRLIESYPDLDVLITTTTPTGAARAAQLFSDYDNVLHQYCPYDQPGAVRRFLSTHRPQGLLVVETELWPNLIGQCKKADIPVVLGNGRMSAKSAKGYGKFQGLTRRMLNQLDSVIAQFPEDGQRFVDLGLDKEKLLISGSIKLDINVDPHIVQQGHTLKQSLGNRPTVIVASSHAPEEQYILETMAPIWQQYPELLLMIVPRHPERFTDVATLAERTFGRKVLRRSEDGNSGQLAPDCEVYIGDTMGELMSMYAAADIAIVGGSFIAHGGQNPVEPASLGIGVLMGPQQFNFSSICAALEAAGGLNTCKDLSELQVNLLALLEKPAMARSMGEQAQAYVASQRGATEKVLATIERELLTAR